MFIVFLSNYSSKKKVSDAIKYTREFKQTKQYFLLKVEFYYSTKKTIKNYNNLTKFDKTLLNSFVSMNIQ